MSGRHSRGRHQRRGGSPDAALAAGGLAAVVALAALTVHALSGGGAPSASAPVAPAARTSAATPGPSPTHQPAPQAQPTDTTARPAPAATRSPRARERAVRRAVATALHGRTGTVDLAITDVTGPQVVHVGEGTPVRTASIVKLLVLRAVQARGPLTRAQRALAWAMITRSDNDATTQLWRASGRDAGIARAAAAVGMTHTTRIPSMLLSWDGWRTTAEDQVRLLRSIRTGPGAADAYTRRLMAHVVPSQHWGVGAVGGATGVKNGWLPVGGRWIVNSDGCVTRHGFKLCLSVLSTGSGTFAEGIRTVELAAAAAVRAWAG